MGSRRRRIRALLNLASTTRQRGNSPALPGVQGRRAGPPIPDSTIVISPLRPQLGPPVNVLNLQGMLTVDATLASHSFREVHAVGDYSDVQGLGLNLESPLKTWTMARPEAETAARNTVSALNGEPAPGLDRRKVARMAALSMPDVSDRTLLVRSCGRRETRSG